MPGCLQTLTTISLPRSWHVCISYKQGERWEEEISLSLPRLCFWGVEGKLKCKLRKIQNSINQRPHGFLGYSGWICCKASACWTGNLLIIFCTVCHGRGTCQVNWDFLDTAQAKAGTGGKSQSWWYCCPASPAKEWRNGKSSVLSFCVSSPVLLQLYPSSVCVPFLNTHAQTKAVLARGRMEDRRRIFIPYLGLSLPKKC